jgi:hypothetical protein
MCEKALPTTNLLNTIEHQNDNIHSSHSHTHTHTHDIHNAVKVSI